MNLKRLFFTASILFFAAQAFSQGFDNLLEGLIQKQDYRSNRISSYDVTGENRDFLSIEPGKTVTLAEINGPAIIHHIWVTISAEPFYGKKIVFRMYWDDEEQPSVEAPIGDFFGVGHGLNRDYASLPFVCTSEGRARNCFWQMPFKKSARIEVTNEGSKTVGAFYYYIDYREVKNLPEETRYFHAQYRQEFPPTPVLFEKNQPQKNLDGKHNYLLLDAEGAGHYVGVSYSILNRTMGWWGEGDDFIWIDGERFQSFNGTGSEDYFCDAWGMRQSQSLFYGCPLQEPGYDPGDKATVYRFHISDPIPFQKSIRVSIEHGHANNRSDYLSSVVYWYQTEPHKQFARIPAVQERLPFAVEVDRNALKFSQFEIANKPETVVATIDSLLFYDQAGLKLSAWGLSFAAPGERAEIAIPIEATEKYRVKLLAAQGINHGKFKIGFEGSQQISLDGFSDATDRLSEIDLGNQILSQGVQKFVIQCEGKNPDSRGMRIQLVTLNLEPEREFIQEWYVIGPFDNPRGGSDTEGLMISYPPEKEIDLRKSYQGKDGLNVKWQIIKADEKGFVDLDKFLKPNDSTVAYALTYVWSPDEQKVKIFAGSDDGIRIWLNDELVHHHLVKRGPIPDNDRAEGMLKKGWNKLLIKVEEGEGWWGFYVRIPDPEKRLRFSIKNN
ncbi:MAG TPA: glycoside hydrolase family 172 protein [bacterium]